ncbi:MAG: rod-binding protein [Treponema sp.]|jgi:flagellar protein FlgJ|nr:rod-binding protein [Treponema sp.]
MEPGNVSSLYFEDVRFGASSLGIGKNVPGGALRSGPSGETGGFPSFTELLERNYGTINRDEAAPSPDNSALPAHPAGPEGYSSIPPSSLLRSQSNEPVVDKAGKLYEQCEALETFLVKILLSGLRNTVQKNGLMDDSFAGKMYEDMLYDEYAKDLTRNAGFGLAELAYLELTGQRGKLLTR